MTGGGKPPGFLAGKILVFGRKEGRVCKAEALGFLGGGAFKTLLILGGVTLCE